MLPILFKTLPFFALIALGYWAGRTRFFTEEATAYLTKFVFYFALSAMIFRFAANLELAQVWDGKLVARMDSNAERAESVLHIYHLSLEPTVLKIDALFLALRKELQLFLQFNHCNKLRLHRTSPAKLKPALQVLIHDLAR